jgi:L-ascorbate metabolism protein UlaG (beta-lactamase superfamily)
MRLSQWGHACVRLADDGTSVVVDPGIWSDVTGALDGADHLLLTHEHADHLAVGAVREELDRHPDMQVYGPEPALALLSGVGVPTDRLHPVEPGDRLDLGGIPVLVGGGVHDEVHPDVPRVPNLGYLVGPVWHPGDSLDLPPEPARVLLVPAAGPWLRIAGAVDLIRAVAPELALPIHDAIYSEQGKALADTLLARLGGAGEYRRTRPGEVLSV